MAKISFLIIILVVNQSLADVVPATNKLCISGGYCYKGTEVIEPNFKKYQAYFGIPYADPPIGPLRFKVEINKLAKLLLLVINNIIFRNPKILQCHPESGTALTFATNASRSFLSRW